MSTIGTTMSPKKRVPTTLGRSEARFAAVMVAPAVMVLLVLVVYPIISGMRLSLYDYSLLSRNRPFAGFANFIELATDARFRYILWNTVLFALLANTFSTLIGLATALLLNNTGKLTGTMRGLGYLPWITPGVVYVFVWGWILSKNFSPINGVLLVLRIIETPISFLGDTTTKFLGLTMPAWSVVIIRTWSSYPFKMTMLLAALQNIPGSRYDAARVDGANVWQQFRRIVLPLSSPGMVAAGAFAFMLAWREFLWASIMLSSGNKKPISVGLRDLIGQSGSVEFISEFMAVAIAATIPAFVLFFFTQRYIAAGITAGAVKA